MEEQRISFQTWVLAELKGFKYYPCTLDRWLRLSRRCTQSELQKWLRDIHNLHIYIDTTSVFDTMHSSKYKSFVKVPFQPFRWTTGHYYLGDTYEEALEKALLEALKLIKND